MFDYVYLMLLFSLVSFLLSLCTLLLWTKDLLLKHGFICGLYSGDLINLLNTDTHISQNTYFLNLIELN